jgi:hypothetical protein
MTYYRTMLDLTRKSLGASSWPPMTLVMLSGRLGIHPYHTFDLSFRELPNASSRKIFTLMRV